MAVKTLQVLVSALAVGGLLACGSPTDSGNQKIGPLSPEHRARFDRTVQLVGEVTQLKGRAPELPTQAQLRSLEERKAQIFQQVGERCSFVNEVAPPENPTPTPPPAPEKPKTEIVEKGVMSKKKGEPACPITYWWKQKKERVYDKDAATVVKTVVTEEQKFSPDSNDAKGGMSILSYTSKGEFQKEKKADKEVLTGHGNGTVLLLLDGSQQTLVITMRASGVNKDNAGEFTISYDFVYGDGLRVELKSTSKTGAAQAFTINRQALDQKEFEAYLAKFGVPAKAP